MLCAHHPLDLPEVERDHLLTIPATRQSHQVDNAVPLGL